MTSNGSNRIEAEYWNAGAWSNMRLIWIDTLNKKQMFVDINHKNSELKCCGMPVKILTDMICLFFL